MSERIAGEAPRVSSFDGLRGIGMLLVLLRHVIQDLPDAPLRGAILRVTSLGNSAMDLFFVMSGFLITGLLYDAKDKPGYFRNYFARRCLRVFPLYYLALVLMFWVVPALPLALPASYALLRDNQAWYWTYTTNVLITLTRGQGTPLNTGHFWSLAVEEQFYLIWPLLLFFLDRRGILRLCAACTVLAILFRLGLHRYYAASGVYVLSPARMDSLAIGGFLAVLSRDPGGMRALARRCVTPLWVALAAVAVIVVRAGELNRRDVWNYLGGYTLVSVMYGCLLVILAADAGSRGARLVGHPIWAHLGRHSYAMYIVHYPLLAVLLAYLPAHAVIVATGGTIVFAFVFYAVVLWVVSYALSLGAFHLFEKRFLNLKRFFPSPPAVRVGDG